MGSKNEIPPLAGPYGGMLGMRYDPVYTDFTAEGTKRAPEIRPGKAYKDPLLGIRATDRFQLPGGEGAAGGTERLETRRSLLGQFNQVRREFESSQRIGTYGASVEGGRTKRGTLAAVGDRERDNMLCLRLWWYGETRCIWLASALKLPGMPTSISAIITGVSCRQRRTRKSAPMASVGRLRAAAMCM